MSSAYGKTPQYDQQGVDDDYQPSPPHPYGCREILVPRVAHGFSQEQMVRPWYPENPMQQAVAALPFKASLDQVYALSGLVPQYSQQIGCQELTFGLVQQQHGQQGGFQGPVLGDAQQQLGQQNPDPYRAANPPGPQQHTQPKIKQEDTSDTVPLQNIRPVLGFDPSFAPRRQDVRGTAVQLRYADCGPAQVQRSGAQPLGGQQPTTAQQPFVSYYEPGQSASGRAIPRNLHLTYQFPRLPPGDYSVRSLDRQEWFQSPFQFWRPYGIDIPSTDWLVFFLYHRLFALPDAVTALRHIAQSHRSGIATWQPMTWLDERFLEVYIRAKEAAEKYDVVATRFFSTRAVARLAPLAEMILEEQNSVYALMIRPDEPSRCGGLRDVGA